MNYYVPEGADEFDGDDLDDAMYPMAGDDDAPESVPRCLNCTLPIRFGTGDSFCSDNCETIYDAMMEDEANYDARLTHGDDPPEVP